MAENLKDETNQPVQAKEENLAEVMNLCKTIVEDTGSKDEFEKPAKEENLADVMNLCKTVVEETKVQSEVTVKVTQTREELKCETEPIKEPETPKEEAKTTTKRSTEETKDPDSIDKQGSPVSSTHGLKGSISVETTKINGSSEKEDVRHEDVVVMVTENKEEMVYQTEEVTIETKSSELSSVTVTEKETKKKISIMTEEEFQKTLQNEVTNNELQNTAEKSLQDPESPGITYKESFPGVTDDSTAVRALKGRVESMRRVPKDEENELQGTLEPTVEKIEEEAETKAMDEVPKVKDSETETLDEMSEVTTAAFEKEVEQEVVVAESEEIVTKPKMVVDLGKSGVKFKNPSHIVIANNQSAIIADLAHTYVVQVDVSGKVVAKYDIKHNVRSLAVYGKILYVASKEKIYSFVLGMQQSKPDKLRPKADIFCIAAAGKDSIVICDQTKGQILEFNISAGTTTLRLVNLENPVFISTAETPDGRCYIVSVGASNRIQIYTSDWKLRAWFDRTTFGDLPLNGVSGTTFSSATTIMVADRMNDRICEYNVDGTFMRHVLLSSHGVRYPACLAYNEGKLWVTESEGNHKHVKLFRIPDPPKEKPRRRLQSERSEKSEADEEEVTDGNTDETIVIMQKSRGGKEPGTQTVPREIAITKLDTILIVDRGSTSVQEMDIAGQILLKYTILEPVASIAVLEDKIYVASTTAITTFEVGSEKFSDRYGPKTKITNICVPQPNIIVICNFDNGMVFEYDINHNATDRKLSGLEQPRCVCFGETSEGPRYLVTLWGHILSHCVNVYNETWQLLASINGQGTGYGHLFQPVSTIITSPSTFWIAEGRKHQISEFSLDGAFIRRVLWTKHGLHHPTSIAYTNGFVWVSECEPQHGYDRIKLFKLVDAKLYPGQITADPDTVLSLTMKAPQKLLELNKGSNVKMKRPIQIAPYKDSIMLADKDLASVQQIDKTGKVLQEFSVRGPSRGVAVCQDKVYIATKENIFVFTIGVKSNKPVHKFKPKIHKIFTIAVADPDNIVMCDKYNGVVVEHSTKSDKSRVVVSGLEMPHYISVGETSEGRRYFVTLGGSLSAHSVNIYSSDWTLLGTATARDSGDGQLRVPMGTYLNSPSTFVVSDWANNRVTEFHIDGTFSRHIAWTKHGIAAPGDIVCEDNHLWVTTYPYEIYKESVKFYKLSDAANQNSSAEQATD